MRRSKVFVHTETSHQELYFGVPSSEIVKTASIFGQAYNIYVKGFELAISKMQLSLSQWLTLAILFTSPKPVNAMQFTRFLPIEAPTVSQLLNRLEERDLLVRKHSRKDKRTIDVYLTDRGHELLKETIPAISACLENAFSPLTQRDLEQLDRISTKVRNNCLKSSNLNTAHADQMLQLFIVLLSKSNDLPDDFWQKQ